MLSAQGKSLAGASETVETWGRRWRGERGMRCRYFFQNRQGNLKIKVNKCLIIFLQNVTHLLFNCNSISSQVVIYKLYLMWSKSRAGLGRGEWGTWGTVFKRGSISRSCKCQLCTCRNPGLGILNFHFSASLPLPWSLLWKQRYLHNDLTHAHHCESQGPPK